MVVAFAGVVRRVASLSIKNFFTRPLAGFLVWRTVDDYCIEGRGDQAGR